MRRAVRQLFACLEAQPAAAAIIVCAESLTAGLLSAILASVPGASRYLWGSWICYQKESKEQLLGVPLSLVAQEGVVSEAVAREMALGALRGSPARYAVALTGEAGPVCDGAAPKGRVWMAFAARSGQVETRAHDFRGSRNRIRWNAALTAVKELRIFVEETSHQGA
jgi:nicotinamide-nucleotide amidase